MIRTLILALGGLWLASAALPEGDPEAGRKVAGMCRTCHGLDGYAKIPIAPHIGGEPAAYLSAQLTAFRDGTREHEMMSVVSKGLSDQQIADVSAWYASHQATATLKADPSGAPEACISCHGADGISRVEDAPNLAGETNIYIETQLKAFRTGKRVSEVMGPMSADLTDAEIRDIANWFADIGLKIDAPD